MFQLGRKLLHNTGARITDVYRLASVYTILGTGPLCACCKALYRLDRILGPHVSPFDVLQRLGETGCDYVCLYSEHFGA